jgi:enoyl-CoA hydratase/carnithine racemase
MSNFDHLEVRRDRRVRWVTLNLDPPNLMTFHLLRELDELAGQLEQDDDAVVVVFESSNSEFFISHSDLRVVFRTDLETTPPLANDVILSTFNRFRHLPMISIAKVVGRVGGSGAGFVETLDMRFGVIGSTIVNRMEVPLGMTLGGGSTGGLVKMIGLARTLEMVCGGRDIDAQILERWGWLSRAWPSDEIDAQVYSLAHRIATFSPAVVRQAKRSAVASIDHPASSDEVEHDAFWESLRSGSAVPTVERFLSRGGQTVVGERQVESLVERCQPEVSG